VWVASCADFCTVWVIVHAGRGRGRVELRQAITVGAGAARGVAGGALRSSQFMAQFISFAAGALPTTNSPFCEDFVAPGQTGQGAFWGAARRRRP
jgi:hypothetical protein